MCGTMPSVQPNAATTLAFAPRERPAASVYSTPVPGDTITISEVTRNSQLISASLPQFERRHPEHLFQSDRPDRPAIHPRGLEHRRQRERLREADSIAVGLRHVEKNLAALIADQGCKN